MTNTRAVCLISIVLFCSSLSLARQLPKECAKGPKVWCQSLKQGADCGAVGHCIATVWEKHEHEITKNDISEKFIRLFRQLKDVKDLINEEYLATRVSSACREVPYSTLANTCKENTAHLENYLMHILQSETSPETMCNIIGICNNKKLDNAVVSNKKNTAEPVKHKEHLLGSQQCTWGPSYWCSNFSTGRECKATHHCVQRVWSQMTFPEDNDDICKICTDMVQQARDQLLSNETQEELKEVFEGSCKLIPIKIVAKECIKLADDFVPELVETLSSQMNPQAVCSVAGLCNNDRIDKLLEEYNSQLELRAGCNNCQRTVGVVRKKFEAASYDDFLVGLLQVCRKMGSLSDSCSMLVFKYYENILEAVKKDLNPHGICHISGQCSFRFHTHEEYTFPKVNQKELKATDNVPCEFCEQLVVHLRDVLVANTTELEFQKVLKGLCKQTGNFKDECLHLVEEYYTLIYYYLVTDLKPKEICVHIGICGNTTDVNIAPLLPKELAVKVITPSPKLIGNDEANSYNQKVAHVPIARKQSNVRIIGDDKIVRVDPLPIERMFVSLPNEERNNKAVCSFCEYFLHYLQVELSDTNTEERIKEAVEKACDKLPKSIDGQCRQFVTEYGQAVVALLVQEIDPASVCPALRLCPQTQEVRRVAINSEKSNCPLCLFAMEQLETVLKNNHTKASISHALDSLCVHLSQKLRTECLDFVDTYSQQIIEMIVADLDAKEICVYLKLCSDDVAKSDPLKITHQSIDKFHDKPQLRGDRNNFRKKPMLPKHMLVTGEGDIETNEIPDNTVNGRPIKPAVTQKKLCVICEFVMKEIDDEIKDKNNEDEIKTVVEGICRRMPKSVRSECDQFVDKYADMVISLLAQELDPAQVCVQLKMCDSSAGIIAVKEEILDCAICETVVMAVKKVLNNDKMDRNIVHIVEKSCGLLPAKYSARCHTLLEIYGDSIIHLIEDFGAKDICKKIGLCTPNESAYVHMYREKRN